MNTKGKITVADFIRPWVVNPYLQWISCHRRLCLSTRNCEL